MYGRCANPRASADTKCQRCKGTGENRMTDTTVATETWRQLGGNRFGILVGAHPTALDDTTLSFQIPHRTKNGANRVTIELTPADVYTVVFWRTDYVLRECVELSRHEDIYCDVLRELFERETGLLTSL
jgi:hypothetical protein